MDTASVASCGFRTILTLSSPAKAKEGVGMLPKASAGRRTQEVAMAKSRSAEFVAQRSTCRLSALTTATEAEVRAQAHQPPSPDSPTFLLQANSPQAPVEAIALKLVHIIPPGKAIALNLRMIRRLGEILTTTNL